MQIGFLATVLTGFALPISTSLDSLLLVVILLAWLACGDWKKKLDNLLVSPVSGIILVLLLLAVLGMSWGLGSLAERLRYFTKYTILLLPLCLIALPLPAEHKRRAALAFGAAILLTLASSYALWFGISFPGWLVPPRDPSNPVVFKLHITHSFFVALGAFLFVISSNHVESPRWRWGLRLAALLAATNLFIVQGRTGQLTLAVLVAYLFIHHFRWRGLLAAGATIAAGVVVMLQVPDNPIVARYGVAISDVQNLVSGHHDLASMDLRVQYAATSLRIIAEHPLFGVGTGGFAQAYDAQIVGTGIAPSNNPHNQFLLTTAQFGIPGLIALLALFVILWRTAHRLPPAEQLLARGLVLAYLVGNLFNSFLLDHTEKLLFAWAIGLLYSGLPPRDKAAGQESGPG